MNARLSRCVVSVMLVVVLALALAPFAGAQEGNAAPAFVELVPYDGNPIIPRGPEGAWDSGHTCGGAAIVHDGLFHMFYTANAGPKLGEPGAIGYATSQDGLSWTKYEGNPVLTLDAAFAPLGTTFAVPVVDGDTWMLFLNPLPDPPQHQPIVRATAPAPTGPWTVDPTPLVEAGPGLVWDAWGPHLVSALRAADEFVIYYQADPFLIGRAVSPDGLTWTKYDNPATTLKRLATSDPVFVKGDMGTWDQGGVFSPTVYASERGWIMVYGAFGGMRTEHGIGLAWSPDGIAWTRYGETPLLSYSVLEYEEVYPDSIVMLDENTFYVYYNATPKDTGRAEIGVWIATIRW